MHAKQILYVIYVTVLEHEQITTVRKYRFRIMLNYDLFFLFFFLTKNRQIQFLIILFNLYETSLIFLVFHKIFASCKQNGCMGAYKVIDLEQFPVRISTDKAPTPLTKYGIYYFFFCHSRFFLSFFLCTALSDS